MKFPLFIEKALAQTPPPPPPGSSLTTLQVTGGGFGWADFTFPQIVGNIVNTLVVTIVPLAVAVFIAGAALFVISAGDEGRRSQGKSLMIGALIGVGVVAGAKGILNTVMFFIYGQ